MLWQMSCWCFGRREATAGKKGVQVFFCFNKITNKMSPRNTNYQLFTSPSPTKKKYIFKMLDDSAIYYIHELDIRIVSVRKVVSSHLAPTMWIKSTHECANDDLPILRFVNSDVRCVCVFLQLFSASSCSKLKKKCIRLITKYLLCFSCPNFTHDEANINCVTNIRQL